MKIAICYYGLAYNMDSINNSNAKNQPVNYLSCYESHKNNLWLPNNPDIFIHSWSTNVKDDILKKYSPVSHIIEDQIDFYQKASEIDNDYKKEFYYQRHHVLSRHYSEKKVIQLKAKLENENNFKYDIVMITRFDCIYNSIWSFENLNMNYFYVTGGWPCDYSKDLPDLWFFSNSDIMNIYGRIYDEFNEIFKISPLWSSHRAIKIQLDRYGLSNNIVHYKKHYIDSDIKRG
jgi:hypothetical protein